MLFFQFMRKKRIKTFGHTKAFRFPQTSENKVFFEDLTY